MSTVRTYVGVLHIVVICAPYLESKDTYCIAYMKTAISSLTHFNIIFRLQHITRANRCFGFGECSIFRTIA